MRIPPSAHTYQSDVETVYRREEDEFFDLETFPSPGDFLAETHGGWYCRSPPLPQYAIQLRHFQRAVRHLVKPLGVGLLGALDGAIQLWGAGRQDEQAPASLLAGLLEFSSELAAVIDLHSSDALLMEWGALRDTPIELSADPQ